MGWRRLGADLEQTWTRFRESFFVHVLESFLDLNENLRMNADMMDLDFVSLRIFLSCPRTGIKDYQSLQKYGVYEWEIHRLLWIG